MREEIPGLEIVRLTGTAAATSTVRRGAPATAWSQVQMNEILYCYNVKLYIIHTLLGQLFLPWMFKNIANMTFLGGGIRAGPPPLSPMGPTIYRVHCCIGLKRRCLIAFLPLTCHVDNKPGYGRCSLAIHDGSNSFL